MASTGKDPKCVSVCQCMSLPLSVVALNCVVDIVNVRITHFLALSYSHGVYVCLVFIFDIVKDCASLILPMFLEKLYAT